MGFWWKLNEIMYLKCFVKCREHWVNDAGGGGWCLLPTCCEHLRGQEVGCVISDREIPLPFLNKHPLRETNEQQEASFPVLRFLGVGRANQLIIAVKSHSDLWLHPYQGPWGRTWGHYSKITGSPLVASLTWQILRYLLSTGLHATLLPGPVISIPSITLSTLLGRLSQVLFQDEELITRSFP